MFFFLGWGAFMRQLKGARLAAVIGPMGTGKTLFSTAALLALYNDRRVLGVSTNYPCSYSTAPTLYRRAFALDEAGIVFDSRLSFKSEVLSSFLAMATFTLRKFGNYLFVPTFIETDKRLRAGLRVWRTWALGVRFWSYHWEMGPEEVEERRPGVNFFEGSLWLVNPAHFFGKYDTYFTPGRNLSMTFLSYLVEPHARRSLLEYIAVHDAKREARLLGKTGRRR